METFPNLNADIAALKLSPAMRLAIMNARANSGMLLDVNTNTLKALVRRGLITLTKSGSYSIGHLATDGRRAALLIALHAAKTGETCKRCGGEARPTVTGPAHVNNPDAVCGPRYCHYALSN